MNSGWLLNPAKGQDGFILVVTLWVLAAITLAASFFALWTNRAVDIARQGQEELQGEIDQLSTRSAILYLLATRYMTVAGLTLPGSKQVEKKIKLQFQSALNGSTAPAGGELPLDDRVFRGVGSALFSIQDEGGLIGLNSFKTGQLGRLLGLLGIPADQWSQLLDKLADYIDRDNLLRLNGAEADDYRNLGLPPPANRFLLSSWEAKNVLGWGSLTKLWNQDRLPRLTTVARAGMPNFNNAPLLVLQSMAGIDAETAARIIKAREQRAFTRAGDIYMAAGKVLPLDVMSLFFLPTSHLRLTIWNKNGRRMGEVHVNLTPVAANPAPWGIDYELTIPLTDRQQGAEIQNREITVFTTPLSPDQ